MGDPYSFLESAISPPETLAIRNALKYLHLNAVVVEETGASAGKGAGASPTASFLGPSPGAGAVRAKDSNKGSGSGSGQGQGLSNKGAGPASPNPDAAIVTRLKSQITPLGFHLAALPVRLFTLPYP